MFDKAKEGFRQQIAEIEARAGCVRECGQGIVSRGINALFRAGQVDEDRKPCGLSLIRHRHSQAGEQGGGNFDYLRGICRDEGMDFDA